MFQDVVPVLQMKLMSLAEQVALKPVQPPLAPKLGSKVNVTVPTDAKLPPKVANRTVGVGRSQQMVVILFGPGDDDRDDEDSNDDEDGEASKEDSADGLARLDGRLELDRLELERLRLDWGESGKQQRGITVIVAGAGSVAESRLTVCGWQQLPSNSAV